MSKIRVISFVPGLGSGGIAALMREWYKRKDKEIVFDIATIGKGMAYDELVSQGCTVYSFEPISSVGIVRYVRNAYRIIVEGEYDIVHSHVGMVSCFIFIAALLAKRRIRILHAHGIKYNRDDGRIISTILSTALKSLSVLLATHYLACSNSAAIYLFGKRIAREKAIIINNGIDLQRFKYKEKKPGKPQVIGYISRFEESKNNIFLLKVLSLLLEHGKMVELLLVGDGDTKRIKDTAEKMHVDPFVRILPAQKSVEECYYAMDLFAFPSLYEGLGIVAIEAQACGVPTIVSPGVPDEVLISTLARKIELDVDRWVIEIEHMLEHPESKDVHEEIVRSGFDIDECTNKLMSVYLGAIR